MARHLVSPIIHREDHITPMSEGVDLRQRRVEGVYTDLSLNLMVVPVEGDLIPPLLARGTVSFFAYRFDQYLCMETLSPSI